ncbi:MAG: ribosome assembly RNA-binding protein YhbY [Gammaproteobacteria bacterium]|nr:ribosome assembly RNA-binding protein YhbY [Gammaproteobacteria bacterium]
MHLSKDQIKHLLKLTHHLKPIISIGQNGITDNVMNELDIALNHHELVKIKIAGEDRDARQAMIQQLCDQTSAEKIQAIGKTLTLFRRNPEKPKIQF